MQKGSSFAILNPLDLLELFISMIELMTYVYYSFFSPVVGVSHVCYIYTEKGRVSLYCSQDMQGDKVSKTRGPSPFK